ncbi:mediator of RNA polymerase II transcription subunit, partial [Trifolium medium]|nr:mediator of RNA polymerase II transcription subunit [Trifolium medium]
MENIHGVVSHVCNTKSKRQSNVVIRAGSQISFAGQSYESSWFSLWLPIDLILEDALDGGHVAA